MAKKKPEPKETSKPGATVYDRLIVCQFEEDNPFSYVSADIRDGQGTLWIDIIKDKMNPLEAMEIHQRCYLFVIKDEFSGVDRLVRVFARVQDGVHSNRLDNIIDDLNEELTGGQARHLMADYQNMVEFYYEKVMTNIAYVKRVEGKQFIFPKLDKMNTRQTLAKSQAPITDESDHASQFSQKTYKEKISEDDPAIVAAKKYLPKSITLSVTKGDEVAIEQTTSVPPPVIFADDDQQTQEEPEREEEVLATISLTTSSTMPPSGYTVIDPDEIVRQHIAMDQAARTQKPKSPPALQRTESVMPQDLSGVIDAIELREALELAQRSRDLATQHVEELDETTELQTEAVDMPGPSKGKRDRLPHNASNNDILLAIVDLRAWIEEKFEAVELKYDTKLDKFNKKLDNKFAGFNALKLQTRDIHENVTNLSMTETVKVNTFGNMQLNPEAKSKAWGILFRVIPFNALGKSIDVFFAFLFVQEQLVDFIAPTLDSLPMKNMNVFLARNCLMNTLTQMARSHMIYGGNKASIKMMTFIKRPLPKGLLSMMNKQLIPRVCVMKKLDLNKDQHHFADIQTPISKTLSNEYGALLTNAANQSPNIHEAADLVVDWDYKYYKANKFCLGPDVKVPASKAEHKKAVMKRSEITKTIIAKGLYDKKVYLPMDHRLTEMYRDQGVDVDCDEMLDIIMASAYLLGYDPFNLAHEQLPDQVPELDELYEAAKVRNKDILDLVNRFSADARNNIPHLYIDQLESRRKGKKRAKDDTEEGEEGESSTPSKKSRSASVSPRKRYPFTQFRQEQQPASKVMDASQVELDSEDDFVPELTEKEKAAKEYEKKRRIERTREILAEDAAKEAAKKAARAKVDPPEKPTTRSSKKFTGHLARYNAPVTPAASTSQDPSTVGLSATPSTSMQTLTSAQVQESSSSDEVSEAAIKTPPRK